MKQRILMLLMLVIMGFAGVMTSCNSGVNISDMDTAAEVDMGLAIPVGTLSATMGDFIGLADGLIKVDEDGVLYINEVLPYKRKFHKIDLSKYISNVDTEVGIVGGPVTSGTAPVGTSFQFEHTFTLQLNGINSEMDKERFDKAYIKEAKFTAYLGVQDFDLPFSDLQSVKLILPDCIERTAGNVIEVPLAGHSYGEGIPFIVDDFTINLMKDQNAEPSNSNVLNSIDFTILYNLTSSRDVTISENSKYKFGLVINFLEYNALWGYFAPDNTMHDNDTIVIEKEWAEWANMKNAQLQLAEPKIELYMWHYLGMPLIAKLNSLKAIAESEGTEHSVAVTFGSNESGKFYLNHFIDPQSSLDNPVFYDGGTEYKNYFLFDKEPQNGNLDELFSLRPDKLVYDFEVVVNTTDYPEIKQYRITPNDTLYMDIDATIPFKFNPNVAVSYTDTLKDVNINLSVSELIGDVEVVDSLVIDSVKLIMEAVSYLPFNVHVDFTFLDENNEPLTLEIIDGNNQMVDLPAPNRSNVVDGVVTTPTRSAIIIRLDNARLEQLSKVRAIKYEAFLGNNAVYSEIHDDTSLKINIGLSANVDAFLHLNFFNE